MKKILKKNKLPKYDNETTIIVNLKNEEICEKCQVKLNMSSNGMLGLGKSLIRDAHKKRHAGSHWHFDPLVPGESRVQTLGTFLSPDSCEICIGSQDTNNDNTIAREEYVQIDNNLSYKFNLKENFDILEEFEKEDNNILQVQVYNKNNKDITQQCYIVGIWLTTNAMLGLGTELIRLAHNFEEGKTITIEPSTEAELKQTMGIFLTPDSCPLTIECKSFGTIDQCIEDYVQKNK